MNEHRAPDTGGLPGAQSDPLLSQLWESEHGESEERLVEVIPARTQGGNPGEQAQAEAELPSSHYDFFNGETLYTYLGIPDPGDDLPVETEGDSVLEQSDERLNAEDQEHHMSGEPVQEPGNELANEGNPTAGTVTARESREDLRVPATQASATALSIDPAGGAGADRSIETSAKHSLGSLPSMGGDPMKRGRYSSQAPQPTATGVPSSPASAPQPFAQGGVQAPALSYGYTMATSLPLQPARHSGSLMPTPDPGYPTAPTSTPPAPQRPIYRPSQPTVSRARSAGTTSLNDPSTAYNTGLTLAHDLGYFTWPAPSDPVLHGPQPPIYGGDQASSPYARSVPAAPRSMPRTVYGSSQERAANTVGFFETAPPAPEFGGSQTSVPQTGYPGGSPLFPSFSVPAVQPVIPPPTASGRQIPTYGFRRPQTATPSQRTPVMPQYNGYGGGAQSDLQAGGFASAYSIQQMQGGGGPGHALRNSMVLGSSASSPVTYDRGEEEEEEDD